jgi:hypothetical protein
MLRNVQQTFLPTHYKDGSNAIARNVLYYSQSTLRHILAVLDLQINVYNYS